MCGKEVHGVFAVNLALGNIHSWRHRKPHVGRPGGVGQGSYQESERQRDRTRDHRNGPGEWSLQEQCDIDNPKYGSGIENRKILSFHPDD